MIDLMELHSLMEKFLPTVVHQYSSLDPQDNARWYFEEFLDWLEEPQGIKTAQYEVSHGIGGPKTVTLPNGTKIEPGDRIFFNIRTEKMRIEKGGWRSKT